MKKENYDKLLKSIEEASEIQRLTIELAEANKRVEELENKCSRLKDLNTATYRCIWTDQEDELVSGLRVTDAQIDAAWACIEENRESGNEDLMQIGDAEERMLHNCFGIVRCAECGGSGVVDLPRKESCFDYKGAKEGIRSVCPNCQKNGPPPDKAYCPACNGHRWVVKDE